MKSKKDDHIVNAIIHNISLKNNITSSIIREIVESQFKFAYDTIRELEFSNKTEEELEIMKTNFYFKYLGKLYINPKTTVTRSQKTINYKEENGS